MPVFKDIYTSGNTILILIITLPVNQKFRALWFREKITLRPASVLAAGSVIPVNAISKSGELYPKR